MRGKSREAARAASRTSLWFRMEDGIATGVPDGEGESESGGASFGVRLYPGGYGVARSGVALSAAVSAESAFIRVFCFSA